MAQTRFASINLNPDAEPFFPPRYYLVINPQLDHGHVTPAYYYPLPTSYNFMTPQPIAYPSPLEPVYQQLTQYQAPSPPQYYVPAQQINQSYPYNSYGNMNGYTNGNYMNSDRSANEYHNRGRNGRGNSRNFRCDQNDCHYQRHYKNQRNHSNENWNNYNGNGNRNHYKPPSQQNHNVQYVDNYNYNHSNEGYYHHQESEYNNNFKETNPLSEHFGELDVEAIEANISD
ncbi:putative uncharacterized protein DDB_G0281311 [Chironomus tepperi]|uniref:putative uncharacterized protein DDB_G0281311 n=1 Tax=Chironomus tepperi TaxID=113505 RepID=UPI00391F26F5